MVTQKRFLIATTLVANQITLSAHSDWESEIYSIWWSVAYVCSGFWRDAYLLNVFFFSLGVDLDRVSVLFFLAYANSGGGISKLVLGTDHGAQEFRVKVRFSYCCCYFAKE